MISLSVKEDLISKVLLGLVKSIDHSVIPGV